MVIVVDTAIDDVKRNIRGQFIVVHVKEGGMSMMVGYNDDKAVVIEPFCL